MISCSVQVFAKPYQVNMACCFFPGSLNDCCVPLMCHLCLLPRDGHRTGTSSNNTIRTVLHSTLVWVGTSLARVVAALGDDAGQLASGRLSGMADWGWSPSWTSQTQARLVPEPDGGFVKIQSQNRASRWHLTH